MAEEHNNVEYNNLYSAQDSATLLGLSDKLLLFSTQNFSFQFLGIFSEK
jgi:hypothetical protein